MRERDVMLAILREWTPNFERVLTDRRFGDILGRFNARGHNRP